MKSEEITHSIINILLVVLITAGVIFTVGFLWQPGELLEKSRDAKRTRKAEDLAVAINLYLADGKNFDHLVNGKEYSSTSGKSQTNGQGWIPLGFSSISSGAPFAKLPLDPKNNGNFFYRFGVNKEQKTFEIDFVLESGENQKRMTSDNGNNPARFEIGTDLNILK